MTLTLLRFSVEAASVPGPGLRRVPLEDNRLLVALANCEPDLLQASECPVSTVTP